MSETDRVLEYLQKGQRITPWYAEHEWGIKDLPRVIYNIRTRGYRIGQRTVSRINQHTIPTVYPEYWLIGETDV